MSKNNEPEEIETLDDEQQYDNSDLNENDSNELLDDDNGYNEDNTEVTEDNTEVKEEYNDSEYHHHHKIVPLEYNDQEFDSLSKTEQNKIVRNNIISVIAFFIFFLIIFQIIL